MSDNLGGMFSPPTKADRAAGLRGLGAARRPDTAVPLVPAAPVRAFDPSARSTVIPIGTETTIRQLRPEPAESADYAAVYLGQRVHERLSAYCRRRGRRRPAPSFTSVVLDAVEQSHDRLPELFTVESPVQEGPLFARKRPRRRVLTEPQVQVTLKPGRDNVAVLDRLAAEHGQNRSSFVQRVLDAYLPAGRRR